MCEYIGEVITSAEAEKRGRGYDRQKLSYLYDLDILTLVYLVSLLSPLFPRTSISLRLFIYFASPKAKYVIDARHIGNVARFINHSCIPNLMNMQFWIETQDRTLHRVALFSAQDILNAISLPLLKR